MSYFSAVNKVRISGWVVDEPLLHNGEQTVFHIDLSQHDDASGNLKVVCYNTVGEDVMFELAQGSGVVVDGYFALDEDGNAYINCHTLHEYLDDDIKTYKGDVDIDTDPTTYIQKLTYNRVKERSYSREDLLSFGYEVEQQGYPSDEDLEQDRKQFEKIASMGANV